MKIKVVERIDELDYTGMMEIYIDGRREFTVYDGEPEDNNLSRNFNDCWSIPELMRKAYEAGRNGEEFDLKYIEEGAEY